MELRCVEKCVIHGLLVECLVLQTKQTPGIAGAFRFPGLLHRMMSKPSIKRQLLIPRGKKVPTLSLYRVLYSKMSAPRILHRLARPVPSSLSTITRLNRQFGATALRLKDGDEAAPEVKAHRANQANKVPNQFIPNTTSTMTKDFPNVGQKPPPPEMLNSVDPNYRPSDPYPGRIEHFTGGRQDNGAQKPELGVGEMEGITFKVEPLKRVGEELATKRARLLCSYPFPCMHACT